MTSIIERPPATVGLAPRRGEAQHEAVAPAAPSPAKRRSVVKTVASVVLTLLMVGLLLVAAAVTVVPRLINAVPLTVLTGSMEPAISPGDLVVVRAVDPADLRIGDVVTMQPVSDDPTLVTHRIVDMTRGTQGVISIVTRGDANGADDAPIVPDQVMGCVLYTVPLVGHVTHGSWGPYVATGIGVALVGYCVVMLVTPDRSAKKRKDAGDVAAQ